MSLEYNIEVQVGSVAPLTSVDNGVIYLGASLLTEEPVAEALTHGVLHIVVGHLTKTESTVDLDYVDQELLVMLLMGLKFRDVEVTQDYLYDSLYGLDISPF